MILQLQIVIFMQLLLVVICKTNIKRAENNLENTYNNKILGIEEIQKDIDEKSKLLVPDLIRKFKYTCEVHKVITPDGYIIEMHRIPFGRNRKAKRKLPVILAHGLGSSSADWILTGPNHAFGLMLADAGYDVWIYNARGTRYSRKHVTLDPVKDAKKFFDFSYHEMGTMDMPAIIDYVTNLTKYPQVLYIGHSQGSTISYIMCSEKPEYNNKIKALISFGPVAFLKHIGDIYKLSAGLINETKTLLDGIGMYELQRSRIMPSLAKTTCKFGSSSQPFCVAAIQLLFGRPSQMSESVMPLFLSHTLSGLSLKQAYHYLQTINTGEFHAYDYGEDNMKFYNSTKPPNYKVENINIPVYLISGIYDEIVREADVITLSTKLVNVPKLMIIKKKFNHLDYLYAKNSPITLFKDVVEIMNQYSKDK